MTPTRSRVVEWILAFAAVVEVGTGLALAVDPSLVAVLLLGAEASGVGAVIGRCFGIALLALGVACWPARRAAGGAAPSVRAMTTYNVLIALYLAYLGTVGHWQGLLLWPAAALHAIVGAALPWARFNRRTTVPTAE